MSFDVNAANARRRAPGSEKVTFFRLPTYKPPSVNFIRGSPSELTGYLVQHPPANLNTAQPCLVTSSCGDPLIYLECITAALAVRRSSAKTLRYSRQLNTQDAAHLPPRNLFPGAQTNNIAADTHLLHEPTGSLRKQLPCWLLTSSPTGGAYWSVLHTARYAPLADGAGDIPRLSPRKEKHIAAMELTLERPGTGTYYAHQTP